ncbi:MAG TPA: ATP-binding cassette domain-containing protein [Acidothermaceae bacterium]
MTLDLALAEQPATVELTDVVRTYSGATGGVRALDGVSARFEAGLFTVVAGPSGSGKSTLLRVAALLDRPQEGLVGFNGRDVTRASSRQRRALRRRHIGYMFQQPADNLLDYLDARSHVQLGGKLRSDDAKATALDTLEFLGLAERITHRPVQLSGGEQQRLAFAFAVAGGPQLLVADEPTAALDHVAGARVLEALVALARRGLTVVASSHDPAVIEAADRVVRIAHGRVESA